MAVVTVSDLEKAIKNKIRIEYNSKLENNGIKDFAWVAMSFFGFNERVLDNELNAKYRIGVMHPLEDFGFVSREPYKEQTLYINKKIWRIHHWVLKTKKILEWSKKNEEMIEEECNSVYSNEMWSALEKSLA